MKLILLHLSIDGDLSLNKVTGIYKLQVSGRKVNAKYILQNTIVEKNPKPKPKEETIGALVQNSSILWCHYSFVNQENSKMTPLNFTPEKSGNNPADSYPVRPTNKEV